MVAGHPPRCRNFSYAASITSSSANAKLAVGSAMIMDFIKDEGDKE
jgi:hypothetical protein